MSKVKFPIHHTFGPLATRRQCWQAFKLQFQPWKWRNGNEIDRLRAELEQGFGMKAVLFGSGRDALLAVLRAIEITPGDEVIIQGYTCVVVANAVHTAGGTPVYCDIDSQTLNLDIGKLYRSITSRTRAVICQHTFGIPADARKIRAICDKRSIMLIEDCAHIMPDSGSMDQMSLLSAPTNAGGIGRYADAVILSFGRDKAVSGVAGGAALTKHAALAEPLSHMEDNADAMPLCRILNLIDYPIRYGFAKLLWQLPFGPHMAKAYLKCVSMLGLLPAVVTDSEKSGKASIILSRLPNACAGLVFEQIRLIGHFNSHRRKLTSIYLKAAREGGWHVPSGVDNASALQKFPVFADDASGLRKSLKKEQIYLDDGWCEAVVNPKTVDQEAVGYAAGACPVAEGVAQHIVSLPTHPTMDEDQARYLVHALRSYLG